MSEWSGLSESQKDYFEDLEKERDDMIIMMTRIRDLLSSLDVNCLGSNSDGEVSWALRDEVIDGITRQLRKGE